MWFQARKICTFGFHFFPCNLLVQNNINLLILWIVMDLHISQTGSIFIVGLKSFSSNGNATFYLVVKTIASMQQWILLWSKYFACCRQEIFWIQSFILIKLGHTADFLNSTSVPQLLLPAFHQSSGSQPLSFIP